MWLTHSGGCCDRYGSGGAISRTKLVTHENVGTRTFRAGARAGGRAGPIFCSLPSPCEDCILGLKNSMDDVYGIEGTASRLLDEIESIEAILGAEKVEVFPAQRCALLARLRDDEHFDTAPCASDDERTVIVLDDIGSDHSRLRISAPLLYPAQPCVVTVDSQAFTRSVADSVGAELTAAAAKLAGSEAMFELIGLLELKIEETCAAAATTTTTCGQDRELSAASADATSAAESQPSTVVLHIDHMNDSATYIKKLRLWSEELELGAVVLYRLRTKAVNATSGGKSVTPVSSTFTTIGARTPLCLTHQPIAFSVCRKGGLKASGSCWMVI